MTQFKTILGLAAVLAFPAVTSAQTPPAHTTRRHVAAVDHTSPGTPSAHPLVGATTEHRVEHATVGTVEHPRREIAAHRAPGTPSVHPVVNNAVATHVAHETVATVEHPTQEVVTHRAAGTPNNHPLVGERAEHPTAPPTH